jgi:hypothetical protein
MSKNSRRLDASVTSVFLPILIAPEITIRAPHLFPNFLLHRSDISRDEKRLFQVA